MTEILRDNFSYVDVDDEELFVQFAIDQIDADTQRGLSFPVCRALSRRHPPEQFDMRVREKFIEKRQQLGEDKSDVGRWWWCSGSNLKSLHRYFPSEHFRYHLDDRDPVGVEHLSLYEAFRLAIVVEDKEPEPTLILTPLGRQCWRASENKLLFPPSVKLTGRQDAQGSITHSHPALPSFVGSSGWTHIELT